MNSASLLTRFNEIKLGKNSRIVLIVFFTFLFLNVGYYYITKINEFNMSPASLERQKQLLAIMKEMRELKETNERSQTSTQSSNECKTVRPNIMASINEKNCVTFESSGTGYERSFNFVMQPHIAGEYRLSSDGRQCQTISASMPNYSNDQCKSFLGSLNYPVKELFIAHDKSVTISKEN